MLSIWTILMAAVLATVAFFIFRKDDKKRPPGPMGLPLVGNLLQMGAMPHLKLAEWVGIYGDIFTVKFGMQRMIVLSDAKMIKEAFNDSDLSGRFDPESFQLLPGGKHGIINSEGAEWAEQRRFSLRNLRDLGFGKKELEGVIMEEVNDYLTFFKANEGQPIAIDRRFTVAILNILWAIISQHRVSHDDAHFLDIFNRQKEVLEETSKSMTLFVPWLGRLFPKITGWDRLLELVADMRKLFKEHLEEHKKTFQEDEGSIPRDFIDVYLKEIKSTTDPNSSFYKEKGEHSLVAVIGDLFVAGPDTTSSTMSWSVLYLSKFPEIQKKVQAELDAVIGKNRQPTLTDRPNLPYVCATIEEILRMSSIVPTGVFHRALADVQFHGFQISKGDWICPNQYFLHHSKDIWKDPKNFEPQRHLTNDGKTVKRHEALMPFSWGKRACIGESLARDAIFCFFTTIFQKYKIQLAAESKDVTLDPLPNFVLPPQNFKIVVEERF